MQNDENTLDTQEVEQASEEVVVEETTTEQTGEESQGDDTSETVEARLAKAEAEAAKYRRLFEKTQKAKPPVATQGGTQTASPSANIEETVLLASGMPEELVAELKAVAQVRKTSLIKAQQDPIFIAVKEKFEKDKRQASASLPASRGSGSVKAKKDFTTPGLSRDEHKKLVLGL